MTLLRPRRPAWCSSLLMCVYSDSRHWFRFILLLFDWLFASWIPDRQSPVRPLWTSGPVVSIIVNCDDDCAAMLGNMHKAQEIRRLRGSMNTTPAVSCWRGEANLRFSCPLGIQKKAYLKPIFRKKSILGSGQSKGRKGYNKLLISPYPK